MILKDQVTADLQKDEGFRLIAYDDADGQPVKAGKLIHGKVTIGIGRNLSDKGISEEEANYLLSNDLDQCIQWCFANLSWFANLSLLRQRVIVNMRFQLGEGGFLTFRKFINAMEHNDFTTAAVEMLDSLWAVQTPARAKRLSIMMQYNGEMH